MTAAIQAQAMPPVLTEQASNPRGPVIFGIILIVVGFGGFGIWSALAPLESAVMASGVVVVETDRKVVQHLEGGIVREILVNDGDHVREGDVLLRLDDTKARAVLEIITGQLNAALAMEARLIAERDGKDEIAFPGELLADTSKKTSAAIDGQRQLFEARRRTLEGETEILNQRIAQFEEEIAGMTAQQEARTRQVALYEEELEGLHALGDKGHVARNFILAQEREVAELRGERGKFIADVARSRQGIGEAKLQIAQLEKALLEEVVMRLRETQESIADLHERQVAARDVLDRTVVKAPASGVVIGLGFHTPGGVIGAGQEILQIVPQEDELIFEARVRTTDIDDVVLGQSATVRLSAFSFRNTLVIYGEVIHVSADSLTSPETGEPYYGARVRVPPTELAKLGDATLQPGMPVEVMIRTGEQTAFEYMIAPLKDILARALIEK